jgi:hypothetical protein
MRAAPEKGAVFYLSISENEKGPVRGLLDFGGAVSLVQTMLRGPRRNFRFLSAI